MRLLFLTTTLGMVYVKHVALGVFPPKHYFARMSLSLIATPPRQRPRQERQQTWRDSSPHPCFVCRHTLSTAGGCSRPALTQNCPLGSGILFTPQFGWASRASFDMASVFWVAYAGHFLGLQTSLFAKLKGFRCVPSAAGVYKGYDAFEDYFQFNKHEAGNLNRGFGKETLHVWGGLRVRAAPRYLGDRDFARPVC